uniref:rRNA adenine N(6)-methyltransferase n=1 Tax=Clastoptera arizonana TaxID=38151 RepID=A0A1B6DY39_9HEMI
MQHLRLPPLPSIREIIQLYGLRAQKDLSQNFLLDLRLTDKIARAAGNISQGEVVEVGPGPGGITRSIIKRNPSKVILIEKDRRFLPILEMLAEATGMKCPVELFFGDVRTFNMETIFKEENKRSWSDRPPNIHIIGNLPFSVSTYLIIHWLEAMCNRTSAWCYGRVPLTLTFQKEVGERITAPIMSEQRCRLSVMCQNWCHVEHKFDIPGSAFVPQPNVDVSVIRLTPLEEPVIKLPFKLVEKITRCLFSSRQKYCNKNLELLFPVTTREMYCKELLCRADISYTMTPIQFTVSEIGRLCFAYSKIVERNPKLASYNVRGNKATREILFEDAEGKDRDVMLEDEENILKC